MGCFITAYAREKTIRTSQAIKDYSIEKYGKDLSCYSDTDSIHIIGKDIPNIDSYYCPDLRQYNQTIYGIYGGTKPFS